MKKNYFKIILLLISFSAFAQQPYYSDINTELTTLTGIPLKDALATKITNTHTNTLSYNDAREALKIVDLEPTSSTHVLLVYGFSNNTCETSTSDDNDHRTRDSGDFGGGITCEWNREHVYAQSQGTPALGQSGPGADAHHLRASDVQRNNQRGNLHFITGSGNSGSTGGGWYPGNEWKGDVARIIMYMYVRYGSQCLPSGITIGSSNSVDSNMIDLLLEWNAEDSVSDYEKNRNTYLENTGNTYGQGNRNPFIDNPRLATLIWGGTLAEDIWGIYGGGDTQAPTVPTDLSVSNETSSSIDLDWTASTDDTAVTEYDIYVDGSYNSSSVTNSTTVTGLSASTTYSFTILAKDAANNMSAQSGAINGTTTAGGSTGSTCITETFENIPTNSGSYLERTWTGDNGFDWTATDARTDQTINNRAITIRNGNLTASNIADGIGDLTIVTQRVFSGGSGTFDLVINGDNKGTIAYNDIEQSISISNINIGGAINISIENNSGTSNRVRIDDLTWTCYSTLSVDDELLSNLTIYPNPTFGSDLYISTNQDLSIQVFNILGKHVLTDTVSTSKTKIDISSLNSGIYLIRLSSDNGSITRKFIKK